MCRAAGERLYGPSSADEVAREPGIDETTLAARLSRARRAGGEGTLGGAEREESARLRRQAAEQAKHVRKLEMERDVLKRCTVLWVK